MPARSAHCPLSQFYRQILRIYGSEDSECRRRIDIVKKTFLPKGIPAAYASTMSGKEKTLTAHKRASSLSAFFSLRSRVT